jgi:predicted nucleotidyltransferase component of viral defense system
VITRADLVERVREWGLTEQVIEKDYVLGWLLWGIANDPILGERWVFKGGTCLKKCYIETYRFSEDLDFTVLPGGPYKPEDIEPLLARTLLRIYDASGIDFSARAPTLRLRPDGLSVEGRVYYVGPRQQTASPPRVKLDISANEKVVRPPVLRDIGHPYPDALPSRAQVRCYSFEELFAEKLRAMAQRGSPRDLYDVINLFRRNDLRLYPDAIHSALAEKCAVKSIAVPTAEDIMSEARRTELDADWLSMLGHQLPILPPLGPFLEELPILFRWLDGSVVFEELPPPQYEATENGAWSPPATAWTWRTRVPLEVVRFAATNHLLVNLTYQGRQRLIEPYSLRRTRDGNFLLHAERADGSGHRSYRVDQIQGLAATTTPFRPRRPVEFSARGPLHAPLQSRSTTGYSAGYGGYGTRIRSSARRSGPVYVYQCRVCGRTFDHSQRNSSLRAHQNRHGGRCPGRSGIFVGTR